MRIRVRQTCAPVLEVTCSMGLGVRCLGTALGCGFAGVGILMGFSALPHTDDLVLERRGEAIVCRSSQALAGRWELTSKTLTGGPELKASVLRHTSDGDVLHRLVIDDPAGRLHYGKSHADGARVEAVAAEVNWFVGNPAAPRLGLRERTWWWFLLPFGVAALAVGAVVMAMVNQVDRWRFDRLAGLVTRRRQFLVYRRTQRWPLRDAARVVVSQRTDSDGDVFHNLRLELRSGEQAELCSSSERVLELDALKQQADRINLFLGAGVQPVLTQDERGPVKSRAEVDAKLAELARTHPGTARLLGRFVAWTERTTRSRLATTSTPPALR